MNLGIDFGSTNTVLSVYDQATDLVNAIVSGSTPNIPSVVSLKQKASGPVWSYGELAKSNTGKKNTEVFKTFKMLLPEKNQQLLQSRGFNEKYTPSVITAHFLEHCLSYALQNYKQTQFENLVICAPEIWSAAMKTADGRPILRDICKSLPFVKKIQVVSEPAAASAFFAYNYEKNTQKKYQGHILLIDYGGGTLDITLTKVYMAEKGNIEIKVLSRTGAGENEDGRIGKAGVAYMENVILEAVKRAGLNNIQAAYTQRAVDELEAQLRGRVTEIKAVFDMYGISDPELQEEPFVEDLPYGNEELCITYGDLVSSYQEVIEPVLKEKIQYMIDYMDANHINYQDISNENFKISCVGGFGTYYLVEKQIASIFHFSAMDKRISGIITTAQQREWAISYGAALIASGTISIRSTSPYSVGIYAVRPDGKVCTNFAIRLRQDIEYNKPYYQRNEEGKEVLFFVPAGAISSLIINTGSDERGVIRVPIKNAFQKKLQNLVSGKYKVAHVGFSLDESEVLSIYVQEYDFVSHKVGDTKVVELSRFNELLETAVVEPIANI